MGILIVSCVFPPEPVVSAKTSSDIAEELTRSGYNVCVVTTFPSRPGGKIYPGFRRTLYQKTVAPAGYEIVRLFSFFSTESTFLSRFLENVSFGLLAAIYIACFKKPYAIYANTWPIFAMGMLRAVSAIRHIPIAISIQDIYPESLSAQRRISKKGSISKFLASIDRWIASGSQAVIVISERFRQIYLNERKVHPEKVVHVSNWVSDGQAGESFPKAELRNKHGIPENAFLLVYGGNIGVAAGVQTIVKAFSMLDSDQRAFLFIAGDGSEKRKIKDLILSTGKERVSVYSPWPVNETWEVYSMADVLLLPTTANQSLVSVPSKLMSYMFAAKPIVALAVQESDIARIIKEADCGWVAEPDRPDLLASLIFDVMELPAEERTRRGENGRIYALQHFSRERNTRRIIELIEKL